MQTQEPQTLPGLIMKAKAYTFALETLAAVFYGAGKIPEVELAAIDDTDPEWKFALDYLQNAEQEIEPRLEYLIEGRTRLELTRELLDKAGPGVFRDFNEALAVVDRRLDQQEMAVL